MTAELVSEWARGRLANYDGETIGVLAVDGDGAAAAVDTMAFVSEVVAYEIDRGTALASVDQVGSVGVLNVATALLDTSAGTPAGVWFFDNSTGADATRRLLSFLPTIEAAGFVDWPAAAPDGIGTWRAAAPTTTATAASVSVDATGFTGNLSGTDTDVQTALDTLDALTVGSGGGASNVFIFDSSLATADNHYETWPELCAAYALVDGPKVIHVDGTETIPAGTWTCFGSEAVEFSGNGVDWFITGGSVLTVSDGVVFDPPPLGIRVTQGLKWSAESTDYIWQCDAGSSGIAALAGGTVACTYPIIRHDGGSTSVALLEAAAGGRILNGTDGDLSPTGDPITAGSSPLIDMVSGIAVTSQTYGIAHVSDDVFTGSASFGVTKIDTTAATNQPTHAGLTAGGSITLLNSKAENESYDNGTSGLTATDVQAAIDEIVASGGGGGVSLGETSTTAYRGDRGKTAYDHSQATGNPHGTAASDITSGTFAIARIPTGTSSSTVAIGNDSRLSDARTPTSHASSHGSGGGDPITVAQSQVTSLTTDLAAKVPTSRTVAGLDLSADRSAATMRTAVKAGYALGGQATGSAVTDATSGIATGVSLLGSTITLPTTLAAGDALRISGAIDFTQNSGGGRTVTITAKLGSTSACAPSTSWSASASSRAATFEFLMRCTSTSAQTWSGSSAITGAPVIATGSSAEDTTSAKALDILITATANSSQSYTLKHLVVTYMPA